MTRDPDPWWDSALCATTDPEIFTPNPGDSTRPAKRICAACPVIDACLVDALVTNEQFSIRGGLAPGERRQIKRDAT